MSRFPALCCLAAAALLGCDDGATPKGPEDGALSNLEADSKADTWRAPTDHGRLSPGLTGSGTFADGALFHAWTFDLSAAAKVELTTRAGDRNLDTVMYLYRQDPETGYWGRYIAKNDDTRGTVFSRIAKTLDAGAYRIIVKGHKAALRGDFTVGYTCEGEGCVVQAPVVPEVGDAGYTAGCAARLAQTLRSEPQGVGRVEVAVDDLEGLTPQARLAAEWFIDSALDWASASDLAETSLEIETHALSAGALVDVTIGADWSYTYVFGAQGELLVSYFNDQSPYAEFYCAVEGEAAAEAPEEFCVGHMLAMLPHAEAAVTLSLPADVPADLAHWTALAEAAYRADTGVAADAPLTWVLTRWDSARGAAAGDFAISTAGEAEIVYTVGGEPWDTQVLFSRKGDTVEARCLTADDLAGR